LSSVSFFIYGKPAGLSELDRYMSISNHYAPQRKFTSNTRKSLRPKPRIFFQNYSFVPWEINNFKHRSLSHKENPGRFFCVEQAAAIKYFCELV